MKFWSTLLSLVLALNFALADDELETVEQTEFLKLISEEHYVVALFCPNGNGVERYYLYSYY